MNRKSRVALLLVMVSLFLALSSAAALAAPAPPWPDWSIVFVAHRGLAPGQPENTLAAFREAIRLGAEVIEIDLRSTKDGEVVILHDETLDRTTSGKGKVTDFTLAELKKLDAGNGERIPTYEETLKCVAGTGVKLLLDIKESPLLDKKKVVRITEKYGAVQNVIVGPRNVEDLKAFRALNPNLRTLGFIRSIVDIDSFLEAGCDIIRLWPHWINADPELVKYVQRRNHPVWTTLNDAPRKDVEALVKLGVNGVLSDLPDMMVGLIRDMNKARGFGE